MGSHKELFRIAAFAALFIGCIVSADSFGDMGHCIDATCGAIPSISLPTVVPNCTKDDIGYSFSSCEKSSRTRKVTYFWRPPAICNPTPEVTLPHWTTIPCDARCYGGSYLDVNSSSYSCRKCDAGSYSTGIGTVYSTWDKLPIQFQTRCWAPRGTCQPWTLHGDYIDSGDQNENNETNNVQSTLSFSFSLPREDSIDIVYKSSSENGFDLTYFYLDGIQIFNVSGLDQEWQTLTFDVSSGYHTLEIVYEKDFLFFEYDDRIYIKNITVWGLTGVDLSCTLCQPGYAQNKSGATSCYKCPAGTYSDVSGAVECTPCPQGQTSYEGATSCFVQKKCLIEDYTYKYTACDEATQTRQKVYDFIQPPACDTASAVLPESETVPCEALKCHPGQEPAEGVCRACPDGTASEEGVFCTDCVLGWTSTGKTIYFEDWTTLPEGWSTTCVGQCSGSGWRTAGPFVDSGAWNAAGANSSLTYSFEADDESSVLAFKIQAMCNKNMGAFLYDNGVVIKEFACGGCNAEAIEEILTLNSGIHRLSWVLESHASNISNDECGSLRIYSVSVSGVKGLEGGATECSQCPPGTYGADRGKCGLCPAGTTSGNGDLTCTTCPDSTFSGMGYRRCVPCGSGTIGTVDHDKCTFSCQDLALRNYDSSVDMNKIDNAHFNLSFVLRRKTITVGAGTYSVGICDQLQCDSSSNSAYLCATIWDTASQSSVVIPGDVISFTSYKSAPRDGIVAMFNSSELDRCLLSILFKCDPTLQKDDIKEWTRPEVRCDANVIWKSKLACRTCSDEDISYTFSECISGKKTQKAHYRSEMCISDYLEDVKEVACENKMSISVSMLIVILVVCFVVLLASISTVVVLVLRNRKIYGKYKRLQMESESNLDVMSVKNEVVPSAASDAHGEEEEEKHEESTETAEPSKEPAEDEDADEPADS